MNNPLKGLFNKENKDKEEIKKKNQKLTNENMRIRVHRLQNGSPIEIGIFNAGLKRDVNDNTIIFSEENKFKEEVPGMYDSLVYDILYKLENRGLSLEKQAETVKNAIIKQEKLINEQKNGSISKTVDGETKTRKINIKTEKSKLRLLKCIRYTIENRKGEGFFESIEKDGTRALNYLVRDGYLIPYWHKTPDVDGEPVSVVPDVVQRKKFWKETTDETINDFNESQDFMWKGILGFLTKGLYFLTFAILIIWTVHNARWDADLYDNSLAPQIKALELQNEKIRQQCITSQVENTKTLVDYAKIKLKEDQEINTGIIDKSNINI